MKTEMIIIFNRGNEYFDTYYIYDAQGRTVGIIEDHCRGVKTQYFIGWKLDNANVTSGKTQMFDTKEEAMMYSVGQVVKDKSDSLVITVKVQGMNNALDCVKKYLAQRFTVKLTSIEDGYYSIERTPQGHQSLILCKEGGQKT